MDLSSISMREYYIALNCAINYLIWFDCLRSFKKKDEIRMRLQQKCCKLDSSAVECFPEFLIYKQIFISIRSTYFKWEWRNDFKTPLNVFKIFWSRYFDGACCCFIFGDSNIALSMSAIGLICIFWRFIRKY